MIRINEIQEKLLHLVGWEQSYDTAGLMISESLTKSESGLYFQQAHPLITLENLSCIAPDFKNINYPEYSQGTDYKKGNIVKVEGKLYKALKDTNEDPVLGDWMPTEPLSVWIEQKTRASIAKAISRFINEKLIKAASKNILENKTLFDGTGRIVDTVKNKRNLVGFEITPIRAKGVTTKINKIGLQFTEPGDYYIYLLHSSVNEPINVFKLTKTKKNSIEWFDLNNVYLPYENDTINPGGSWYLCYFQSDLPTGSQAIRKERDWSKGPCNTCSRYEYESWKLWSKYLEVYPFYVNEELVYTENNEKYRDVYLWDIENNQYLYDTNYGLNLDITISCDLTDFIISQRSMFADIILKQFAVDILREFAYNPSVRTNRHSINASRTDILYEVDGDSASMKKSGLAFQLDQAYSALSMSTKGIDRVCLPCVNNGVRYRVV